MSLCDSLQELAAATWTSIQRSSQVFIHRSEQGLTDEIVTELRYRHAAEVPTRTFSPKRESEEGADWEWWVLGDKKALGFRVQAKVINKDLGAYPHLHYKRWDAERGRVRFQGDILIDRAVGDGLIPLYCFYSAWRPTQNPPPWHCGTLISDRRSFGCAVAPAFAIRSLRKDRRCQLTDVLPLLRPWHCLFCCNGLSTSTDGYAESAEAFWRAALLPFESEPETSDDEDLSGRYEEYRELRSLAEPPDYVTAMIEERDGPSNGPSGVRYVTVFKDSSIN